MTRGGKLNVNIDSVRLVSGEKAPLRAVKELKGGGHTGAMTGAIVATSIVFFPAAPLFLFMHGKDITIPKGTEITAYVNGDILLDPAKFSIASNQRTIATNAAPAANTIELSTVAIKSNPDGADIMIDGKFVGNAPSTVKLTAGEHVIRIEKSGFKAWQRQISINSAGSINVEAVLEKADSGETASSPPNQPLSRAKNNEQEGGVVSNPETSKQVAATQVPPTSSKSETPSAIVNLRPFPDSHKATSAGTPNRNTREATTDFGKDESTFYLQ